MPYDYASPRRRPLVVKYGGNAMAGDGAQDPVLEEVVGRHTVGEPVVLVHGGGPGVDRALTERGIATRRVNGLRVTDAATLAVTEAVLCGTLNKRLVRACRALGAQAVGISGQDGPTLVAIAAPSPTGEALGHVGEITRADPRLLQTLLRGGFLPIVAPLAVACDWQGAYNVNADSAAAAIAAALQARAFVIVTNVARVLRDPDDPATAIDRFSVREAVEFTESDGCRASMKPKLQAAVAAVRNGADAAYLCAAGAHAIARAFGGDATIIAG